MHTDLTQHEGEKMVTESSFDELCLKCALSNCSPRYHYFTHKKKNGIVFLKKMQCNLIYTEL